MGKAIGARIRATRLDKKIKQGTIARTVNISQSYLCEIEKGIKNPDIEVIARIAKTLEVSVDFLLYGNPQ